MTHATKYTGEAPPTPAGREEPGDDGRTFLVVVNDEGQYSIWPEELDAPRGWRATGKRGSKRECLAHVDEVWRDLRPLSLRAEMDGDDR